jgi:hypothetical protein
MVAVVVAQLPTLTGLLVVPATLVVVVRKSIWPVVAEVTLAVLLEATTGNLLPALRRLAEMAMDKFSLEALSRLP